MARGMDRMKMLATAKNSSRITGPLALQWIQAATDSAMGSKK